MFSSVSTASSGFGIIEVIVALGLFAIIAVTAVSTLVGSFSVNRLSEEETQAALYAQEGIEAARSLKKQGWSDVLLATDCSSGCGLDSSGGTWAWSGSSDSLGEFTRVVTMSQAQRDGSGNLVASGGTIDPDTYRVESSVSWDFSPTRSNTAAVVTYLTYYEKSIGGGGGMLVYADLSGDDDVIRYKLLSSDGTWGSEQTVPDFNVPNNRDTQRVELYSSPDSPEKILVTKHFQNGPGDDQYLFAQVWDGSSWGNVQQLASWTGGARAEARSFDGDYLANGTFLLVYENNSNVVQYRTWNGSSWSSQQVAGNVGGNPDWIVVRNRVDTNEAFVAVQDSGQDTNTGYWNGSSWGGLTEHGTNTSGAQRESLSFAWSLGSTNLGMMMYNDSNNDTTPNARAFTASGGFGSWGSPTENQNIGAAGRNYSIIARPGADEFLACARDSSNDISCMETGAGPSWTGYQELETTSEGGNGTNFGLAYEQESGSLAVLVYSGNPSQDDPKFRTYDPSSNTWGGEAAMSDIGSDLETVRAIPQPNSDDILFLMAESSQDLWSVVWNGASDQFYSSGDRALIEHGTNGSGDNDVWYDFAWDDG